MAGVDNPNDFQGTNIIYHSPFPGKKNLLTDFKMINLLDTIKPDGIISHFASGTGFFNSISYGKCPVSVIAMGHDVLYDKGDGYTPNYWKFLIRQALKNTDLISAKSNVLKDRIISYGVQGQIEVNYWGADFNIFKPVDKEEAKKELGISNIKSILLSPRAIEPRLNILLIVEAFNEIKNIYPDLTLLLVGRAEERYKNKICDYIENNDLQKRVRIFEQCSSDKLNLFYNVADVVVSMGSSEGFPNSVLEVMACKIPFIIGEIDQIKELLTDNFNSSFSQIDKYALVKTLIKVFNEAQEKKQKLIEEAYNTVSTFGNINENGRNFVAKFKELIYENKKKAIMPKVIRLTRSKIFEFFYFLIMIFRKIPLIGALLK